MLFRIRKGLQNGEYVCTCLHVWYCNFSIIIFRIVFRLPEVTNVDRDTCIIIVIMITSFWHNYVLFISSFVYEILCCVHFLTFDYHQLLSQLEYDERQSFRQFLALLTCYGALQAMVAWKLAQWNPRRWRECCCLFSHHASVLRTCKSVAFYCRIALRSASSCRSSWAESVSHCGRSLPQQLQCVESPYLGDGQLHMLSNAGLCQCSFSVPF